MIKNIIKHLSLIPNAWHFYYALVLLFEVVCSGFDIALLKS
ncbi:DUF3265 domain-containing protein [Vibrio chagasii]|nr:DUF3265 domain-containing protein [Vibrio chagasii]MCG9565379.1 DUF3265 domain-containing protein [Vibrio chagasii]